MCLGHGPLPVLQTFGQRAILCGMAGFEKEWVIVPGLGVGIGDRSCRFRRPGFPIMSAY
jgi:hypothetical protein